MEEKQLTESLRLATARFLRGILGTWCCLGPIIILTGSGHSMLKVGLFLLLLAGYGYIFHTWSGEGIGPVKRIMFETRSAFCFMIIGLLLTEMTDIFAGLKLVLTPLYAFIGFFLAVNYSPQISQIKLLVQYKLLSSGARRS